MGHPVAAGEAGSLASAAARMPPCEWPDEQHRVGRGRPAPARARATSRAAATPAAASVASPVRARTSVVRSNGLAPGPRRPLLGARDDDHPRRPAVTAGHLDHPDPPAVEALTRRDQVCRAQDAGWVDPSVAERVSDGTGAVRQPATPRREVGGRGHPREHP